MIIIENEKIKGADFIIPLSYRAEKTDRGANTAVWANEKLRPAAELLEEIDPTAPDPEKIKSACKMAAEFAAKHGFCLSAEDSGLSRVYTYEGTPLDPFILPGTRRVTEEDAENEDEDSLISYFDEDTVGYGIFKDGIAVSVAQVNPSENCEEGTPFADALEIGVETLPEYQRQGYGISCVAALLKEIGASHRVMYVCERKNEASVALAEKLGLKLSGSMFFCVCLKKSLNR